MKSWQARTLAGVAAALAIVLAIVLFQDRDDDRMVEVNTGPGVQLDARPQAEIQVDDSSGSIPDRMLKDIAEVALGATGGGVVTGVERSDDPGEAFEVEVVRNGIEVDVALDEDLRRVPNERFSD